MPPADVSGGEGGAAHDAYAQPTPRLLYVHDDLTEEGATSLGPTSPAVVDDTIFSGLTMRSVLEALSPDLLSRTHAFCLRGVSDSVAAVSKLCPLTAGVAAPGRLLEDVSFINASGLVRRVSIRRQG